ncbi:MAG: hypothetical protein CMJ83_02190 [Planctomycetes bacterium]|nr:hypothetical protein [Planctomycetota bacterium]
MPVRTLVIVLVVIVFVVTGFGAGAWLLLQTDGVSIADASGGVEADAPVSEMTGGGGREKPLAAEPYDEDAATGRRPAAANERDLVQPAGRAVTGFVFDDRGAALSGVNLSIYPRAGPRSNPLHSRTREDGRFSFAPIAPGQWVLEVRYVEGDENFLHPFPRMELTEGRDDIRLEIKRYDGPRVEFEARIIDADTKRSLRPENASLNPKERVGSWHLPKIAMKRGLVSSGTLGPGEWELKVKVADGRETTRTFTVAPGETKKTLTVAFARPGRVTFRVRFAGPRPPRTEAWASHPAWGADARWQRLPGVAVRYAPVGDDGVVRFMEVRPGPFHVRFTAEGYLADHTLTMPGGGDLTVEVELQRPGRLRVNGTAPRDTRWTLIQTRVAGTEGGYQRTLDAKGGEFYEHELDVLPGEVEWRVVYRSKSGQELGTKDGKATVRMNETVAVTVE